MRIINPSHNGQPSNDEPTITGVVLPPIDDDDAYDLLDWAITRNKPLEFIKSLVDQGLNIVENPEGYGLASRLLQSAAMQSSLDVVQFLILHGANVNKDDSRGKTPLHYAAQSNPNIDVLEYLIDQGADVHATDIDGKKPLDCTYDEEAKRILRDAMVATSNASIARTLGDS